LGIVFDAQRAVVASKLAIKFVTESCSEKHAPKLMNDLLRDLQQHEDELGEMITDLTMSGEPIASR
jgi:hypothetical protein